MSTPYRIEYKGISSLAFHSDGYPLDVIQEVIPVDLKNIEKDEKEWIADIAKRQGDYYAVKIDDSGNYPAEYTYLVDKNKNDQYEVTVIHNSTKIATVNMPALDIMSKFEYDLLFDQLTDDCEFLEQHMKDMLESYGHKIYIEVKE